MPGKKRARSESPSPSQKKAPSHRDRSSAVHQIKRFPIQDIHELLDTKFSGGGVKNEAAVFLTAVLEYIGAEILEQATNVARSRARSRGTGVKVTLEDIVQATESDPEMKELLDKVRKANANQKQ